MPKTKARQPLLDLHVPQSPDGTVTATMPLAWCFKSGTVLADKLEKAKFVNPHLLLVVRKHVTKNFGAGDYQDWEDAQATLVPLKQALQYVQLRSPGENQLLAFVVDVADKTDAGYLARWAKHVNNGVVYGSNFDDDGKVDYQTDRTSNVLLFKFLSSTPDVLTVVVPKEMFAPEPSKWRRNIVQRVFGSGKAVDQCHFRRRFWFAALPAHPIIFVVATLSKLLLLTVSMAAFAHRRLAWREVLRPFTSSVGVISASPDPSSWFFQYPASGQLSRSTWNTRYSWRSLFSPLVWFVPGGFVTAIVHIPVHYTGSKTRTHPWWTHAPAWWKCIALFDLAFIAVPVVLTLLVFVLSPLLSRYIDMGAWDDKREAKRRLEVERKRAELLAELTRMTCGTEGPALSAHELSKDKQTIHLRFAELKTKVCKPFAQ